MRDYQRKRVYDWEDEEIMPRDTEKLGLEGCLAFASNVYRGVRVLDGRGRRSGVAYRRRCVIALPRFARTRPYIIHECAHLGTDDRHGPMFVRYYIQLLDRHLGISKDALWRSALDYGLDVGSAKLIRL